MCILFQKDFSSICILPARVVQRFEPQDRRFIKYAYLLLVLFSNYGKLVALALGGLTSL